ncbi:MAG: hypothetical protein ABSC50_13015 [Candidatus Bathyarchaeia archaeon]
MNTKAVAKSTAALAVIVIVLVAGLAGTIVYYSSRGPSGPTTPSVPTPSFVSSSTMVNEGGNEFQWLDPAVSYYQWDYQILNNQYETLLWYNGASSTEIIPWLADSYTQVSPTQYTFKLRQGINFQDGTPFKRNQLPRRNAIQCSGRLVQPEPASNNGRWKRNGRPWNAGRLDRRAVA